MGDRVQKIKAYTTPTNAKKMLDLGPGYKPLTISRSGTCPYKSPLDRNMPSMKVALLWELFVVTGKALETSLRSELLSPDSSSLSSRSVSKSEEYDVGLVE